MLAYLSALAAEVEGDGGGLHVGPLLYILLAILVVVLIVYFIRRA